MGILYEIVVQQLAEQGIEIPVEVVVCSEEQLDGNKEEDEDPMSAEQSAAKR